MPSPTRRSIYLCSLLLSTVSCSKETETTPQPPQKAPVSAQPPGKFSPSPPFLLLSQVQFEMRANAEGKRLPKPGPAKLLQLKLNQGKWTSSTLEDPDSRVFHKAVCVNRGKETRLLTIGATDAHLKTWQWQAQKWIGTSHWKPSFGGKWDRLRDFEFADVDHDQKAELILATHDQGVIAVAEETNGTFEPKEVFRKPNTFIHEIEVGDTNGDDQMEFFATPSAPNRAEASQGGGVLMFEFKEGKYVPKTVADFPHRHAKEILVTDLNQDGIDELYVSLEAHSKKVDGKRKILEPLEILQLTRTQKGKWLQKSIATLDGGVQARVLLAADLRGTHKPSLIVTTMRAGIWELLPTSESTQWDASQIDPTASGFELAAGVADLDQDGNLELYAAADNQDEIRAYRWTGRSYSQEVVFHLPKRDLTWTIETCQ